MHSRRAASAIRVIRRRSGFVALALLAAASSVSVTPFAAGVPGGRDAHWPHPRHDAQRTGSTSVLLPQKPVPSRCVYRPDDHIYSEPVLDPGGTIYIGVGRKGTIHVLDADCSLSTIISTGVAGPASASIGADGTTYIVVRDTVVAVQNNQEKWRTTLDFGLDDVITGGYVTLGGDGTVYLGVDYRESLEGPSHGVAVALNPGDGSRAWTRDFGARTSLGGHVLGKDGRIYVTVRDTVRGPSSLVALEPGDGAMIWRVQVAEPFEYPTTPAVAADGTIYLGTDRCLFCGSGRERRDGVVVAVSSDGTIRWRYELRAPVFMAPWTYPDGSVGVTATDGLIYRLNPDGTLHWRTQVPVVRAISAPILGGDDTTYTTSTTLLYAFDADGTQKFSQEIPEANTLTSSFVVGSPDGALVYARGALLEKTESVKATG